MKRIYFIGAALILCLLIGGYYFNANRPAQDTDNAITSQAATSTDNTTNTAPAPTTPQANDNVVTTEEPIAVNTKTKHLTHGTRKNTFIDISQPGFSNNNSGLVRFADERTSAESSSDYYGTVPAQKSAKVRKVVRIRPAADQQFSGFHHSLPRNFGIGVELGFNQNGLTNSPASSILTGSMHAGIITNFRLGNSLAFQPALIYINKGTKSMNTMDVGNNEKLALHYLQLPADLVVKIGKPENTRFMIGAGPYVSYLLGARDKFQSGDVGFSDVIGGVQPNYNTSSIPKVDWGLDGFIGCETPEGFFAKAGGQLGLSDIQPGSMQNNAARNYSLMISVGYILSGNHK